MKVSTKGRYALRLMVDLGVNGGEDKYISLKDISARQNISIKYLEHVRSKEVLHRLRVWKHRKMSVSVIMTARL